MDARFMAGWWSSNLFKDNGNLPFEYWVSNRRSGECGEELLLCGLIDAISPPEAEEAIRQHYPDAKILFCEAPPDWWTLRGMCNGRLVVPDNG